MTNPFPPDLYEVTCMDLAIHYLVTTCSKSLFVKSVGLRAWIWLLSNESVMYGKSLPAAGPCEVSSMDLTINPKSLIAPLAPSNMIYLRLLVTAGARHHQEGAGVQERYKNAT